MSNHSNARKTPALSLDSLNTSDPVTIKFRDRSKPLWASLMSAIFSLAGGLCLFSVAVISIFLFDQVAVHGQEIVALLLAIVAIVPMLGILIFEVGHARALAGFRYIRNRNNATGKALLGALTAVVFSFVDPFLALPFVIGGVLAGTTCISERKSCDRNPCGSSSPKKLPLF